MKCLWGVLLAGMLSCQATVDPLPPKPPPVDVCAGLAEMTASVTPNTIRINSAATVSAIGGSGRYIYSLNGLMPVGTLSGSRYLSGTKIGSDVLVVADDCGHFAQATIQVLASFNVKPSRATVAPGTTFHFRVVGAQGTARFAAQGGGLSSQGTISADGTYVAGTKAGTDVIVVRDDATGEQLDVTVTVSPMAHFRPASARLALPTGTFIPLETLDGTGLVTWTKKDSGPGTLEQRDGRTVFVAPLTGGGTTELEARDELLGTTAAVHVRVLTELTRPQLMAQGRRSDVATLLTGDFDGDGIDDVALGVPESDLARPQGGAVFIFKGTAAGLPETPTWTITGQSDTAQFGAVMAQGDLDGDGRADLAIAAPGDDVTVSDSGAVYLYGIGPDGPKLLRPPLTGLGRGNFGAALAIADVDADGDVDLIVGSPGADLAPGGAFSARGVIDIFLMQKGTPIADLGSLRLSGYDLDADGGTRRFSNLRAGRGVVAQDLNGDQLVDLAFLTSVNNSLQPDGGNLARSVIAAQVHFGRPTAAKRFEETPDLFVLPANTADTDEGTWRLGFIPASNGRPPLLVAAADRTDAPDLRASDAGSAGGINAGGALLFSFSGLSVGAAPSSVPVQRGAASAWARVYGDAASLQAGRSFATLDANGDGNPELVLGVPYASSVDAGVTTPNTGKLSFFSLSRLSSGAVVNRADFTAIGQARGDVLGTAVVGWRTNVVAFSGRATTREGDFTGRLDVFSAGSADPSRWTVTSTPTPSRPSSQQFGVALDLAPLGNELRAMVGAPSWSGAASDGTGNEVGAGRAYAFTSSRPESPQVAAEGANTPYATDAGVRAFGGRTLASDVAFTDFDGDGRLDAVIAAPGFSPPLRASDGGVNSTEYAVNRPECAPIAAQSPGGVLVQLGQNDGTWREGFRIWAPRDIAGCTVPDGGGAGICQRSFLSRSGIAGGLDFDGDGKGDLAITRNNGIEVFTGRPPDDAQLSKPSMVCAPLFSFPFITQTTSMPTALGDLNGDGCDEFGFRYSDGASRQGAIIVFGYDVGGTRCGGRTQPSWVRISGDTETGVVTMRLGVALARAKDLLADGTDAVAITADVYPYEGVPQPAVLLIPTAQLVAKRPSQGEALVSITGDGLTPVPLLPPSRALGFGRALAGNIDIDGDGKRDLVVSATGANVNGDGTGAVFAFKGGTVSGGPQAAALLVVADHRERGSFGQDLALSLAKGPVPPALGIGVPLSYRTGTANGTAFVLPLDY